jgi:hypothetical protein
MGQRRPVFERRPGSDRLQHAGPDLEHRDWTCLGGSGPGNSGVGDPCWSDWGGQGPPTLAYPIADVIRSERNGVLFSLHASALAQRIESIEVMDPNTLKVAEIYSAVTDAVWNGADGRSAIASLRQTLQSDHIAVLSALWIDQRGTVPTSSRSAARLMLERIDGTLSRPVTTNDVATQAHLKAMAADVKAALAVVKVK